MEEIFSWCWLYCTNGSSDTLLFPYIDQVVQETYKVWAIGCRHFVEETVGFSCSIVFHEEHDVMKELHATEDEFANVYDPLLEGERHEHYTLCNRFLLMHGQYCVTWALHKKVLNENHAPPYVGHHGVEATIKAIESFFYWPSLRTDADSFVRECIVCQKVIYVQQKPPSLLQPLPIPDKLWKSITMDFVFDLPKTPTSNDDIWTIVDHFGKQAHFTSM